MTKNEEIDLFSQKRLNSYSNLEQHRENLKLIGKIYPKLGLIEIAIRNRIAKILQLNDDNFISKQTFGYWLKIMNDEHIHNQIIDLKHIKFKEYSIYNKKDKLRNYQKVEIAFDLIKKIRNRAAHFENLLKKNDNNTPRLSDNKKFGNEQILIGIDGDKIEIFLNDILDTLHIELCEYLN